jgi:tripartite-type tricarboxylate transporter receptor subunit TctC
MPISRRAILGASLSLPAARASAQAFSTRPVRMVVPFTPGGTVDIVARLVAAKMTENGFGSVIVENRAGAAGTIAGDYVARAAPDGHTLLVGGGGQVTIAQTLFPNLPYNARELVPVTNLVDTPITLWAGPAMPARTYQEFLEYVRARPPGSVNYGSSGVGTVGHLLTEMFLQATGLNMTHVPYRGGAPAFTDMINGLLPVMWVSAISAKPFMDAGQLRPLLHGGSTRLAMIPNTPTVVEVGLSELAVPIWTGLLAPRGTPDAIVTRLDADIRRAITDPVIRQRIEDIGGIVLGSPPAEFSRLLEEDFPRWQRVITSRNIRPE